MPIVRLRILVTTALIAGISLFTTGQVAHATPTTCQFGDSSDFTLSADVWTSTACEGQLSGNDSEGALNSFGPSGMFGISSWDLNSKYDQDLKIYDPAGLLTVSNISGSLYEGDWSVSSWGGFKAAVLVLKGGSGFAAYLLDMTAGLSGEWVTQALFKDNKNMTQPEISHISLYVSAETPPPSVPLPAAGLLLIGALGGLGLMGRRRKHTA